MTSPKAPSCPPCGPLAATPEIGRAPSRARLNRSTRWPPAQPASVLCSPQPGGHRWTNASVPVARPEPAKRNRQVPSPCACRGHAAIRAGGCRGTALPGPTGLAAAGGAPAFGGAAHSPLLAPRPRGPRQRGATPLALRLRLRPWPHASSPAAELHRCSRGRQAGKAHVSQPSAAAGWRLSWRPRCSGAGRGSTTAGCRPGRTRPPAVNPGPTTAPHGPAGPPPARW